MSVGTRHAPIIDSRYSVSDVTYPRPKQGSQQPTYTRSSPATAPATCANVEEEVGAVMREIDREAAVGQGQ